MESKHIERWDWKTYRKMLVEYGYNKDQISAVRKIREKYELCSFEQFTLLFQQKLIVRTIKLKRPRHLYVDENGYFFYLNHYKKNFEYIGHFKTEE